MCHRVHKSHHNKQVAKRAFLLNQIVCAQKKTIAFESIKQKGNSILWELYMSNTPTTKPQQKTKIKNKNNKKCIIFTFILTIHIYLLLIILFYLANTKK